MEDTKMAEIDMARAYEVYYNIINHLDSINWTYDRHDDKLVVSTGSSSDDLPINFLIVVNAKNQVVQFLSQLPFTFPEDKRIDGALAVCHVNYKLIDGSFDYDVADGKLLYRVTCSYRGSNLCDDLFDYILYIGASTVDDYNDKFYLLSRGEIDLMEFLKRTNGN